MINEYALEIVYRGRSPDWFSDSYELTQYVGDELDKEEKVSEEAVNCSAVYRKNDVYLETSHVDEHDQRGFFTAMMGFPAAAVCVFFTYMALKISYRVYTGESGGHMAIAVVFMVAALMLTVWFVMQMHLRKDVFTYRHAAIRFNRKSRQVHVFYSPSLGGARSYNWDDMIPTVEREAQHGFYVLSMIAADPERERYYDTFTVGQQLGKREDCLAWWEYIRRFMEEGPDSVPEPEWYLSDKLSLKESFLRWFPLREMKRDKARGLDIGPAKVRMVLMSPLLALFSLGHFVSMLTSRRVTWPPEIRQACGEA